MSPFQVYLSPTGSISMAAGCLVAINATATQIYRTAAGGAAILSGAAKLSQSDPGMMALTAAGAVYVPGGEASGYVDVTSTATAHPLGTGRYRVTDLAGAVFTGPALADGLWSLVLYPMTSEADIKDGTGVVVATGPWGALASTSYGESVFNGGAPFTMAAPLIVPIYPPQDLNLFSDYNSAPWGLFQRDGESSWADAAGAGWALFLTGLADGSGEIWDPASNLVATRAADAQRIGNPAGGLWQATAAGMSLYSTETPVTTGEQDGGSFGKQDYALSSTVGLVQTWEGVTDPTRKLVWDLNTGLARLEDASGVIATRAGATGLTIDGVYDANATGIAAYGVSGALPWALVVTTTGNEPFVVTVAQGAVAPAAGLVYVTITINGSNEATALNGPFFGSSLPANTSTQVSVPVASFDGGTGVEQILTGAIVWRA